MAIDPLSDISPIRSAGADGRNLRVSLIDASNGNIDPLSDISAGATEEMVTAAPRADVAGLGVTCCLRASVADLRGMGHAPMPHTPQTSSLHDQITATASLGDASPVRR
jgi:hypothetical protein